MSTFLSATGWCYLMAALLGALGGGALLVPNASAQALKLLPRNRLIGVILTLWAWAWAGLVVHEMNPAILGKLLDFLPVLFAFCAVASCFWMGELLSCRALSGLLMLFPMPMILAVRAAETDWRLLPVATGYLAAIVGMDVMLYPWHMRDAFFWVAARQARLRVVGTIAIIWALAFVWAGRALLSFAP